MVMTILKVKQRKNSRQILKTTCLQFVAQYYEDHQMNLNIK